jgi:hypothetical protein
LDPDPDPYWPPSGSTGSGSGSVKNEYGSTTLRGTTMSLKYLQRKPLIFKYFLL